MGHSPDADDAYMFCALAHGAIAVKDLAKDGYAEVHADIQTLNQRAQTGDFEMTQISAGAYPLVSDQYRITACGSSMGVNCGPIVVARQLGTNLQGATIAIPGEHTTAYLLGRIFLPAFAPVEMTFDQVLPAVLDGSVQAGIVIHEGQLSYADHGLIKRLDLGERWFALTGLPLPLGINVVRRDLQESQQRGLAVALRASIAWADAHRCEALAYARQFASDISADRTDQFTRMYVNDLTRDMGPRGRQGLERLYKQATAAGLLTQMPPLDVLAA